jgi:hypothetical protein
MQSKPSGAYPSYASSNALIQRGSRVREKHDEHMPEGERGTVIRLGTEANGWAGFAWVKFDRRSGQWVDLTHLEALNMPGSSGEHSLPGETPQVERQKA